MQTIAVIVMSNKNATDEILAVIARKAVKSNDKVLLQKLARHSNAGPNTLGIIAKNNL